MASPQFSQRTNLLLSHLVTNERALVSTAAKKEISKRAKTLAMHKVLPTSLPSQMSSTKKRKAMSPMRHLRQGSEPGNTLIRAAVATCDPFTRNLRSEKRLSITVSMANKRLAPQQRTTARGASLSRVACVSEKILRRTSR